MKVKLAKTAGFCMGVRRAIEMVLAEANKGKGPIYTYGPLIHNNQVLELLESKGIKGLENLEDLKEGVLFIRAHGISPRERKSLKSSGLKLIDATCPRVAWVQSIIRYHTSKGYSAVITGDMDHPEVIGLVGYANGRAHVVNSVDEIANLPDSEKMFLVAQTTQDERKFLEIEKTFKDRFPDGLVFHTICDATHNRQEEVRSFNGHVDGVVVVGGYHSGNTQRLVQVSVASGMRTFHVERASDLDRASLSSMDVVGVTAGASTPNWMIREVLKEIEAIHSLKETILGRGIKQVLKFLFLSNLGIVFGAFSLAHGAAVLSGRTPDFILPSIAFLYIYAMHVVNRFLDRKASTYSDPERANFYEKNKLFLILTTIASMIGAFVLSYHLGATFFLTIAGLSLLGIIYSIPIVPGRLRHLWRYSKIKDIPGSKTLSMALAWGVVIALLPVLKSEHVRISATVVSFFFVFPMAYVISALFDVFQVQGDLIVGAETVPVILGEKRTLVLLKWILILSSVLLGVAPLLGWVGPFSYLLLLCFFSLALCLLTYERGWLHPGIRMEAMLEGNFILAGLLGLIWQLAL
ncbi:MAG: 4-hydroxy-3-methylbut-2-enyl diphosphate reductase [Pseudomonadota bacterium]